MSWPLFNETDGWFQSFLHISSRVRFVLGYLHVLAVVQRDAIVWLQYFLHVLSHNGLAVVQRDAILWPRDPPGTDRAPQALIEYQWVHFGHKFSTRLVWHPHCVSLLFFLSSLFGLFSFLSCFLSLGFSSYDLSIIVFLCLPLLLVIRFPSIDSPH
jgi:hypothetical protein